MLKETKILKLSELETNNWQVIGLPKNPRFIKDERFLKLKESIKSSPEMLELRELVVFPYNNKYVIIWWNMRYRAVKELWIKEVICKILKEDVSIDKLKEFIIKDNVWFWNDDMDLLANEWDVWDLNDFWLELDFWGNDIDFDDIKSNEDRENTKQVQNIICPHCEKSFSI